MGYYLACYKDEDMEEEIDSLEFSFQEEDKKKEFFTLLPELKVYDATYSFTGELIKLSKRDIKKIVKRLEKEEDSELAEDIIIFFEFIMSEIKKKELNIYVG